mmetsp:Transcript_88085/g.246462  ORF Transcript_88085/g.246462 Transcript_88085/m.246462 type:complete len:384 (-) Transcript_88085:779-1930(-)
MRQRCGVRRYRRATAAGGRRAQELGALGEHQAGRRGPRCDFPRHQAAGAPGHRHAHARAPGGIAGVRDPSAHPARLRERRVVAHPLARGVLGQGGRGGQGGGEECAEGCGGERQGRQGHRPSLGDGGAGPRVHQGRLGGLHAEAAAREAVHRRHRGAWHHAGHRRAPRRWGGAVLRLAELGLGRGLRGLVVRGPGPPRGRGDAGAPRPLRGAAAPRLRGRDDAADAGGAGHVRHRAGAAGLAQQRPPAGGVGRARGGVLVNELDLQRGSADLGCVGCRLRGRLCYRAPPGGARGGHDRFAAFGRALLPARHADRGLHGAREQRRQPACGDPARAASSLGGAGRGGWRRRRRGRGPSRALGGVGEAGVQGCDHAPRLGGRRLAI